MDLLSTSTRNHFESNKTALELATLGATRLTIQNLFNSCSLNVRNEIDERRKERTVPLTRSGKVSSFLEFSNLEAYQLTAAFYQTYTLLTKDPDIEKPIDPKAFLESYQVLSVTYDHQSCRDHLDINRALSVLLKIRERSLKMVKCQSRECHCLYIVKFEKDLTVCPFCGSRNRESGL
ncbi:hypothetical protein ACP3V5_16985 [Vibrio maritimus]